MRPAGVTPAGVTRHVGLDDALAIGRRRRAFHAEERRHPAVELRALVPEQLVGRSEEGPKKGCLAHAGVQPRDRRVGTAPPVTTDVRPRQAQRLGRPPAGARLPQAPAGGRRTTKTA
jgi:hypothetical protein